MGLLSLKNPENCLSVSLTVTITQVQESVSDFNLESKSGDFQGLQSESESHKNEDSHPCVEGW